MNIYLFIYILLIIILFFIIINLILSILYKKNINNILEKFEILDDLIIDDNIYDSAESGLFPEDEDPGQTLSDLKIPNMTKIFEETINNVRSNNDINNIPRPRDLVSLSSSKQTSAITNLYKGEIIQQSIKSIDQSNLPSSAINNRVLPEEYHIIHRIIKEEQEEQDNCCKPSSAKTRDLVCGDHYDTCRVDEEGNDSCCDGYTCLRPNGNFGYKKCLNDSDRGFRFKIPGVDTTGFYDLTIPKTDLSKLHIPSIDISGIKGFNGKEFDGIKGFKIPDVDTTGFYDLTIPKTDLSKLRIPSIDISGIKGFNGKEFDGIKGFNISDIGSNFAKLNPLNAFTCSTDKYSYNAWTGEVTEK